LLNSYRLIHQVPPVDPAGISTLVRSHKPYGKGIGWSDAHLLASALIADTFLWTAEEHLVRLARELGIAARYRHL
jgi:hypothetical protein